MTTTPNDRTHLVLSLPASRKDHWESPAHSLRLARLRRLGLHGDVAALVALHAFGEVHQ